MYLISREKAVEIRNSIFSLALRFDSVPVEIAIKLTNLIRKSNKIIITESFAKEISIYIPEVYNHLDIPPSN